MKKLTCYTLAAVLLSSFAASASAQMYRVYGYGYPYYTTPVVLGNPAVPADAAAVVNDRVNLAVDRAKVRYDKMQLRSDRDQLRYDINHPYVGYTTPVVYYGPNTATITNNWWD